MPGSEVEAVANSFETGLAEERVGKPGDEGREADAKVSELELQVAELTRALELQKIQNKLLATRVLKLTPATKPQEPVGQKPSLDVSGGKKGMWQRFFGSREPEMPAEMAARAEKANVEASVEVSPASKPADQVAEKAVDVDRGEFIGREVKTESGIKLAAKNELLKAGLIGAVYAAIDEAGKRWVIKLPLRNASPDTLQRFFSEFGLIKNIRDVWQSKHNGFPPVPYTEKLKPGSGAERGGLAMEWLDDDVLLSRLLPLPEKTVEREVMAVETMVDYARLTDLLNTDLGVSVLDRKTTDLRLRDGKLVVLDWNVWKENPNGKKLNPGDIYLFASLYYQILAGRYPPEFLDPINDSQWRDGRVSYQTRFFLARCLSPFESESIPANGSLAAEAEKLQKRWGMKAEDLFAEGERIYKEAVWASREFEEQLESARRLEDTKRELPTPPDITKEREALALLDLAVRKGHAEAKPLFDKAKKLVANYPERTLGNAAHAFKLTQYGLMRQALDGLRPAVAQDARFALDFQRWNPLRSTAELARTEGTGLRAHREEIGGILQGLSRNQSFSLEYFTGLKNRYSSILAALPEGETKNSLLIIDREIDLKIALAAAGAEEARGDYVKAAAMVKSARDILNLLPSDTEYSQAILQEIPLDRLSGEIVEMESLAQAQEGLDNWNKRFAEIRRAVVDGLSTNEGQMLGLTLLSRQLRNLEKRVPAGIANEMELKLQVMMDLSFALQDGDFINALELAKKL